MEDIEDFIKRTLKVPTAEEAEAMYKEDYERHINNPNNYSYWYGYVKDCGFKIAKSWIFRLPYEQFRNMMRDINEGYDAKMWEDWVFSCVKPIKEILSFRKYNIKNGTFSNKFDFKTCKATIEEMPEKLRAINYEGMVYGTGGYTEFVVREPIKYDYNYIPTIYNGMPLRPEFRVFYDFDKKEILYTVNYWDHDYCINGMHTINDKIIFEYMSPKLQNDFNNLKSELEKLVNESNLKYVALTGKWSIDFLFEEDSHTFYLIDMALAEQSAYWKGDEYNGER